MRAAWWHFEAGDPEQAEVLAQQVSAQAQDPPVRAHALWLAAHLKGRRNGFAEAVELASKALEVAGDDRLRARIQFELGYCCFQMGDSTAGAAHARAAARHARAIGDQEQLAEALAAEAWCRFMDGSERYQGLIDRALKLEQPEAATILFFRPTFVHATIQLLTQRLDGARQAFAEVLAQALQRGQEADLPIVQFHLVEACLWGGDMAGARSYAGAVDELTSLLDSPTASASCLFATALLDAYEGRTGQALDRSSRALALLQGTQFEVGALFVASVAGFAELSAGNFAGAHRALGALTAHMVGALPRRSLARGPGEMGCGDPGFFAFLLDEVEALIGMGELGQAEAYLAPFEQTAIDLDRPWPWPPPGGSAVPSTPPAGSGPWRAPRSSRRWRHMNGFRCPSSVGGRYS